MTPCMVCININQSHKSSFIFAEVSLSPLPLSFSLSLSLSLSISFIVKKPFISKLTAYLLKSRHHTNGQTHNGVHLQGKNFRNFITGYKLIT